ncbi:peptidoglycan-binding protein [Cypionkella sp.]|uniref:peptidoglycan-binding domain-containing protein n=1 Tax=Cypionkella sp. TaxID=2811411 RepID=UPI0026374CCB|nr:peptidoglycan-binding protein [Cypionkella sp.]MDB5666842.1 peptidoglycan-binding protein [Cypionkella sp.]
MRNVTLPILLAASFSVVGPVYPVHAETDLGKVVSGIAQSLIAQETEKNAYISAQRLNTTRAYRDYLAKYPQGLYRANAEQALAKLGADVPVAPEVSTPPVAGRSQAAIEESIGLTRTQRMQIQRQLTAVGYPTGGADGLWGSKTRDAIARWQKANKLGVTGYVTSRQVSLLAKQAGSDVGSAPEAPSANDDVLEERLLSLTFDERREVQRRLTSLGYNTYGVDGGFGANTRRAMTAWQRDEGLRASGYITADQLRELRKQSGD